MTSAIFNHSHYLNLEMTQSNKKDSF